MHPIWVLCHVARQKQMEAPLEEGVGKPTSGEQLDRMLFDCMLVNGIKLELAPEKEQTLCAEKL